MCPRSVTKRKEKLLSMIKLYPPNQYNSDKSERQMRAESRQKDVSDQDPKKRSSTKKSQKSKKKSPKKSPRKTPKKKTPKKKSQKKKSPKKKSPKKRSPKKKSPKKNSEKESSEKLSQDKVQTPDKIADISKDFITAEWEAKKQDCATF